MDIRRAATVAGVVACIGGMALAQEDGGGGLVLSGPGEISLPGQFGGKGWPSDPEKLPWVTGGPLVPPGFDLRKWLDVRSRPTGPGEGSNQLELAALAARENCDSGLTLFCADAVALEKAAAVIAAQANASACEAAVGPYTSQTSLAPGGASEKYDIACLNSFVSRAGQPASPAPSTFSASWGGRSALAAIGVLKVDGKPFCTALLKSDRTLTTALHCYVYAEHAWRNGAVTVQALNGAADWVVGPAPTVSGDRASTRVGDDWASFPIVTTDEVAAPGVTFASPRPGDRLFVAGLFLHYGLTRYPDTTAPAIQRMVRWTGQDSCFVETVEDDCLRMVCQTTKGFSGAPVFLVPQAGNGSLQVVGFMSGGANLDEAKYGECGAESSSVTLASTPRF